MNLSWTPPSYDGGAEVVRGPNHRKLPAHLFGPLKGDKKFCGNLFFLVSKSEVSEVLSGVFSL